MVKWEGPPVGFVLKHGIPPESVDWSDCFHEFSLPIHTYDDVPTHFRHSDTCQIAKWPILDTLQQNVLGIWLLLDYFVGYKSQYP